MRDLPHHEPPGRYNRPQQPWDCGKSVDGTPCPSGPLKGGRCPHLAECQPIEDEQGQWTCNRSKSRGGMCDGGPNADGQCGCIHSCTPVPSLRTTRGRWMRVAVLAVSGVALMLLGSAWRQDVVMPGPLSSHHAQVLRGERWESRCSACHAAAEQESTEWLAAATLGHRTGPAQSDRCLKCHETTIPAQFALMAHGVDPKLLERDRTRSSGDGPRRSASDQIACSTCHQEHHGANFNMSFVEDARCQACHTQRYDHFATDHPDFGRWPYERRTRLAFDHASHSSKHFATEKTEFDCRSCHQADATGSGQLTLGFEQSCAKCHAEQIELAGRSGFRLFSLPILDTDALSDSGHDVDWPKGATGDFDGRLSPAVVLLLSADDKAHTALARFGARADLFDADPDSPEDMAAVATLAKAMRTLADEMADSPHDTITRRLAALDADAQAAELVAMQTPAIAASVAGWFSEAPNSETTADHWQRDDNLFRLAYQPTGHADPLLKAWLDLAVTLPDSPLRDNVLIEIGGAKSLGTCVTCHTVDRDQRGQLFVNWQYAPPEVNPRGFTRFSHAPHTMQPELSDCRHCHTPRKEASASRDLLQFDATTFTSDFAPLGKTACTNCHAPHAATSRCTTCHGYHVGTELGFETRRMGFGN